MKPKASDWYKNNWSLDMKQGSWVEDTENQVDFLIRAMGLSGGERILDLACGFGRHALSFARRGYSVIGVDITKAFIEDAGLNAKKQSLTNAVFLNDDIRNVSFREEFDVVLNLADGAIGYLENDAENLKIFDVVAGALKRGGKHFMDVCSGEYADRHFPAHGWEIGKNALSLSQFEWDREKRVMLFGGADLAYGKPLAPPEISEGDPTRLYSQRELEGILAERGMRIVTAYSNYDGKPASCDDLQLMVYSRKE